jgi:hypothetical protein
MPSAESASDEEIARTWLAYDAWLESHPYRRDLSEEEEAAEDALREAHGWWALEAIWDSDPERTWRIILRLVELADEDRLGAVAAGPLEELISHHAWQFIDRVEQQACQDPKFRRCLGGVWGWSAIPKDLWPRLQKVGLWPNAQ